MEINTYVRKFNRLVQRIFEEKYELKRCYAENLLKHLDDKNDNTAKILLSTPMFSDLIFHSIENLQNVSTQNKIFIVEVMTILVRNELQFNRLQSQGLKLCLLKKYMKLNLESQYPSMDLHYAYVKLSTAQLCHTSGLKCVVHCKTWENVLVPDIHLRPAHVAKACYEFIAQLFWKLDDYEEEAALTEVLDFVVLPIKTSAYQTLTVFDPENERCISEPIITPMNTLIAIMKDMPRLLKSKFVVPVLKMMYFVKAPLHKVMGGSRDHTVVCLISEISLNLQFALVAKAVVREGKSESDFLNQFIASFLNQLSTLMNRKRMIPAVINFVVKTNIFWSKIGSTLYSSTFERNGQKFQIEDQLISLALVPLLTYTITSYLHADKVLEKFSVKMGNIVSEHTIKSCYTYKMIIENSDMKKITIQAIRELFKLKGLLKAAQAGMVFQSLYYVLELFLPSDEEDRLIDENPLRTSDDVKLLSLVLECMKMLLVEHNIHWYENVEIISLQNGLMNLLKRMTLPPKQLQQVLDLIDLSVRKFLSPDMTLLVESKRGSSLDEIAAVMKSYIQHEEWEVRDSALSLLLSCTDVAFVKYVPLQKLISENGLLLLASHAAFNDSDCYVQTTALQCLAAATKIEGIWRELLAANSHTCKQLIYLLRHCPEGMVRREAANVLVQIYINQKTSPQFEKAMYTLMSSAALDDLHWEVQLAALVFWQHVIKKHLSNKGMIDGKFPKVTFSKEKRKIVVLDEMEVKKQLTSIMNDLSEVGCLTVLHGCLSEDSHTEVMAIANCMSTKLINILNCHGFDKCPEIVSQPVAEPMDETKDAIDEDMVLDLSFVLDTEARREQIIDEIVNTKLADLIMNLNDKYNINPIDPNTTILMPPKKHKTHPNKFLQDFKRTDYVNLIKTKNNWCVDNQTLDVLLDEILDR